MGVASSSLASPPRTKALMVRLAPYLVEAICELTRALKEKTHAQTEISGLLFGKSQDGVVTVEALKTFKDSSGPRSDLARRERMEKAFTAALTLANEDPEFAAYKLLGWFSLRGGGGLINSDVEFHNGHFKNPEEVALIVWREGETQLTTELYAAVEGGQLSTEDYRWSSVRLSTELRHVSQPVDLVMRVRMNDDLYMRTYGVTDSHEKKEEWKKLAGNAKRTLFSFLPGRSQPDVYPEDLPIPEPTGSATRSFESRTLFRGAEEPSSATLPPPTTQTRTAAPGAVTRIQQPTGFENPASHEPETDFSTFDFNRAPRPRAADTGVSGLPMVIPKNRRAKQAGWPWLSTAVVFVLFSGITFGFLALKTSSSGDGKLSQIMRVLFPGSDLELRAASHGDSLWVSWNQRNPVVASATGAVLTVSDGARHFERKLDPGQVADGQVKYTPVSGDVTFQLKVTGADQAVAMSTLRVLDATAPVTAEGKAPLDLSVTNPPTPGVTGPPTTNIPPTITETKPANTAALDAGNKQPQVAHGNKLNTPAMTPPPIPASDLAMMSKATETSKPASTSTPAPSAQQQPAQQQQAAAVQTPQPSAQQPQQTQQTAAANPPPATTPKPVPPVRTANSPQTSNTAINGWDPNLPENKPTQVVQTEAKAPDFVPARVLLQIMPVTKGLVSGAITEPTMVAVEVRVDASGHVKAAHLANPNVKQQLGNAAMTAAKQWTFQPATLRGQPVESDHTIRFQFTPEGQ